jgi:cobaltochelatase CobS
MDGLMLDWPKEIRRAVMTKAGTLEEALEEYKQVCGKPTDQYHFDMTKLWKGEREEHDHPIIPVATHIAEAGIPMLFVGGHGTGKTHAAERLNEILNMKRETDYMFGFASMTTGTSPGEFKGRITLDGFLPSLFQQVYSEGGVYLFDEFDAGEPNLLTLLNMALSNRKFTNNKGQVLHQHEHFVPIAAANTMGLGANRKYTGRNRLDAATLDRWFKIRVEFDKQLEAKLFYDIVNA